MNDPSRSVCEEVVRRVLAPGGESGAEQALGALLWLLRERHRTQARAFAASAFREGFELPDPAAVTVAEEVRDLAAGLGGLPGCGEADGRATDSGMQAVAQVLGELIARWDFDETGADPGPRLASSHAPYVLPAPCASR